MEIKSFVTKGLSTLHVLHAATKKPLYADSDPITGERPDFKEGEEVPGVPVTITGYGSDSNEYRTIQSEHLRKAQEKLVAQHKKSKGKNFIPEPASMEENRDAATKVLAGVITEWTGFTEKGEVCEATERNKEWIIENAEDIREQWDAFVHDRAGFLQSA